MLSALVISTLASKRISPGPPPAGVLSETVGVLGEALGASIQLPLQFCLQGERQISVEAHASFESGWVLSVQIHGWRRALRQMALEVLGWQRSSLGDMKCLFDLLLIEAAIPQKVSSKDGGGLGLFEDSALFPALVSALLFYGEEASRPSQKVADEVLQGMKAGGRRLQGEGFEVLCGEYVRSFLHGKFTFRGLSVASGLGLMTLVIQGARMSALYCSVVHQRPLEEGLLRECLITWHRLLFGETRFRSRLLRQGLVELERVVTAPHHRIGAASSEVFVWGSRKWS